MNRSFVPCLLLAFSLTVPAVVQAGTRSLFDGHTLKGWSIRNHGQFSVEDGAIRVNRGTGWLRSDDTFADFVLVMEFRFLEKNANSGVFVRTGPESNADEKGYPSNGYQIQCMDTVEGQYPLGSLILYGGAASEVKNDVEAVKRAYRPTLEWNRFEITCRGAQLSIKVNGIEVTTAKLGNLTGHIGIQGEQGLLEFRKIEITELPAPAPDSLAASAVTPLFNGRDLTGWIQRGGRALYTIEGDEIVGTCVLNTPNSFLCTDKDFSDFVLEYDFKVDPRLNSGVQIRSECFDQATHFDWQGKTITIAAGRVHGCQVEIDPNPVQNRWWSAGLYDEARRGWLYPGIDGGDPQAFTEQGRRIFRQNDWNHIRVEARGDSLKTWLNGTPCADIRDSLTPRGFIALQVHGIGKNEAVRGAQVRWRNLRITDLSGHNATEAASK